MEKLMRATKLKKTMDKLLEKLMRRQNIKKTDLFKKKYWGDVKKQA